MPAGCHLFSMVPPRPFVILVFILLAWAPLSGYAQELTELETTAESGHTAKRPSYLDIGLGVNFATFRDFATSPLFYSGRPLYAALGQIGMDDQRESQIRFAYSIGTFSTDFNGNDARSTVRTFTLNYLELFQLKALSTDRLNFKLGGQLNATANRRTSEDFFNNGEGFDLIATLFGSVKATLDVSRTSDKERRFLFWNYLAKKRTRTLAYSLNVGIVNSSFRNGFAYTNASAVINEDDFFVDYEWMLFRGFRLNSALDYTFFLKNGNAVQFSYLWDAYRTAGHHDNFEMATHILKCSLLFSLR